MKISDSYRARHYRPLGNCKGGTPVLFKCAFHDKHDPDDPFIVNAVCSSYRPDKPQYRGKIAVTNLRTGELAYVDNDRPCERLDAEVIVEGTC